MTALFQNYALLIALFVLILVFAMYVYLNPKAPYEGFRSRPAKQENTRKHQ